MDIKKAYVKFLFGAEKRARFHQKMVQFTRDGKSITNAINVIHNRYQKEKNPMAYMTSEWIARAAKEGFTMNVARGWIPEAELGLVLAGESADNISTGFHEAERLARVSLSMRKEVMKALGTPLISVALAMLIMIAFHSFMSPLLQDILVLSKWPMFARWLHYFSGFISGFWWALILGALALAMVIAKTMPTYTGSYRTLMDKMPPWSIYKVMAASGFLIALAGMLKQGRPLDSAIKEYRKSASPYVDKYLVSMQALKALGKPEAEAMNVGFLDKEIAGDIADLGQSGGLETIMQSIGEDALVSSIEGIQTKAAIVKYIMLVTIALCIVWMFASFLMTSFQSTVEAKKELQQIH